MAAEEVEIVCGRRHVGHLPVAVLHLRPQVPPHRPLRVVDLGQDVRVLVRHLQKPFQARGRVLRALAVVAVREQDGEAVLAEPFGLAGAQKLVEDDLGAVCEIAKLRLPEDQRVWVLQSIPQFKPEHAKLGERRVGDGEVVAGLAFKDVVERGVARAGRLVVDHGVPVRKRAALHILARQAHVVALREEGAKR